MKRLLTVSAVCAAALLAGCEKLGIEAADAVAARKEAEGKAIGGACRQAGRVIEDCYALNKRADKAAVFAGWREMNDYMRDNKMDAVSPQLTPTVAAAPKSADEPAGEAKH
jgi:hypothetical protein